ncbi:MAG: acetyltransferase-like protein [Chloroflexi bacterium]|jgi:predicted GNAT family acetyltransferase|nr:acetyltransferase-like protein [Chloroflexota bacterium]
MSNSPASNDSENMVVVINNPEQHRYEVNVGNEVAILTYSEGENSITLLHTSVPTALEGRGIAGRLARFALEEAHARKLSVRPQCPFVAAYIRRHSEYMPLLSEAEQQRISKN